MRTGGSRTVESVRESDAPNSKRRVTFTQSIGDHTITYTTLLPHAPDRTFGVPPDCPSIMRRERSEMIWEVGWSRDPSTDTRRDYVLYMKTTGESREFKLVTPVSGLPTLELTTLQPPDGEPVTRNVPLQHLGAGAPPAAGQAVP